MIERNTLSAAVAYCQHITDSQKLELIDKLYPYMDENTINDHKNTVRTPLMASTIFLKKWLAKVCDDITYVNTTLWIYKNIPSKLEQNSLNRQISELERHKKRLERE